MYKNYYDLFCKPYFSEKISCLSNSNKVFVFKLPLKVNKLEIMSILKKVFNVKVKKVRTLIVKGKKKKKKNNIGFTSSWKKVYIWLKKGENLAFINN